MEHLQKQSFANVLQNFTGTHVCWSLFLNNLQAESTRLQQVLSCEVTKIFKNTVFLQNTPDAASVLPVADLYFFKKKKVIKQLFCNLVMTY